MSDNNVRPLPPLFLRPAAQAMDAYADALNLQSWVVAEAIPHSNTLGFNYLCQVADGWTSGDEDRHLRYVSLIAQAAAIIDGCHARPWCS